MTEFQKILEELIRLGEADVAKMENTANQTRDFLSSMEFARILALKKASVVSLKSALTLYKITGERK